MRDPTTTTQSLGVQVQTPLASVVQAPVAPALMDFTAVYRAEFDYVWHTLRRLGVATRNLPDVTHDVFVVVYRRLEQFDPTRPLRPWLFGIALRVAADHHRLARNAREQVHDDLDPHDPSPGPDESLEQAQQRAMVETALASLALDMRAVLILHDLDGQPIPEIASALSIPPKTLYSRLRIAREDFAAAVRRLQLRRGER